MQNPNSAPGGQVYYDNTTGQYYTTNQQQNNPTSNPLVNFFTGALSPNAGRNYIGGSPLNNTYNPIKTDTTIAPYPTTESLFPGLNAGLTQNMQSTTSSMPSSGAGRFLSSGLLSNNTSKGQ